MVKKMNFTRKEILAMTKTQSPEGRVKDSHSNIRTFTYELLEDWNSFLLILENVRDCINADIDLKGSTTLDEINVLLEDK